MMADLSKQMNLLKALDVLATSLQGKLPATTERRLAELVAEVVALQVTEMVAGLFQR